MNIIEEEVEGSSNSQLIDNFSDLEEGERGLGQENLNLDIFEFDNMTYNIYEFQYNVSICYIMMNQIPKAIKMLNLLIEILPEQTFKE